MAGTSRNIFVKESFTTYLESPTISRYDKAFAEYVNKYSALLQEAQKRRSRGNQASMQEQTNTIRATNDLLRGSLPQLGRSKKKM